MSLIKIKLKIGYRPPMDADDMALNKQLVSLGINKEGGQEQLVTYEDWTLNSHVVQGALGIGVFKGEIYLHFVGGFQLIIQYDKKTFNELSSYIGQ